LGTEMSVAPSKGDDMKYVFFHRDRFGSDTAWYIGEGKGKPMVRRRQLVLHRRDGAMSTPNNSITGG
jgi:hypothetical protein